MTRVECGLGRIREDSCCPGFIRLFFCLEDVEQVIGRDSLYKTMDAFGRFGSQASQFSMQASRRRFVLDKVFVARHEDRSDSYVGMYILSNDQVAEC